MLTVDILLIGQKRSWDYMKFGNNNNNSTTVVLAEISFGM